MQKLTTLNEVNDYLSELSVDANRSLKSALQAQMQVVKYVQSPELYDSTFDLFFQNIKQSIRYAKSVETKEAIRQQATLMIQNYVFFLNAKLQYNIQVNRENGYQLFEDACEMLSDSISELILMAGTRGAGVGVSKAMLGKMILEKISAKKQGDSFLTKIGRYITKRRREAVENENFIITMNDLTYKLYKQRKVIGKSDLIYGVIDRYAGCMTNYYRGFDQNNLNESYIFILIALFGFGMLSVIVRAVWRFVEDFFTSFVNPNEISEPWFLNHCLVIGAVMALLGIIYLVHISVLNIRWNTLYRKYRKMARSFDEDE